jgi:hypothetical protein
LRRVSLFVSSGVDVPDHLIHRKVASIPLGIQDDIVRVSTRDVGFESTSKLNGKRIAFVVRQVNLDGIVKRS